MQAFPGRRRLRGTTLVEVMIVLGIMAVSFGGFGMVVVTTQRASLDMRARDAVRVQSVKYVERLLALPFGAPTDPPATAAQVAELFDDNAVVFGGASLTLWSLVTDPTEAGWRFRVHGFEAPGVFEVEVNNDIDGNRVLNGVRGTELPTVGGNAPQAGDGASVVPLLGEGRDDLLRIEVFWNGEPLVRTVRSAPVEGS
jgi:hypothetical protein